MDRIFRILFFVGIVAAAWFVFVVWFRALTSVMTMEDNQFPARHDKILWVVLFLCAPLFAPFLYTACVERFNQKNNP